MKQAIAILLLAMHLNAQMPATKDDPRSSPFYLRDFARLTGNIGGWWSFLTENERGAFLTGYRIAAGQALSQSRILCKAHMDMVKNSGDISTNQIATTVVLCESVKDFTDFDKITIKDLDDFYSDRSNQAILIEWSLPYLRDKLSGRKTKGQLLDALEAEQKDVHDCSKYPHLCKLGAE